MRAKRDPQRHPGRLARLRSALARASARRRQEDRLYEAFGVEPASRLCR